MSLALAQQFLKFMHYFFIYNLKSQSISSIWIIISCAFQLHHGVDLQHREPERRNQRPYDSSGWHYIHDCLPHRSLSSNVRPTVPDQSCWYRWVELT